MTAIKKILLNNLIVLLLYISCGFLGLLLAVPPGYATAIWAPSGIALGSILAWGLGTLPGIFIASFLLNFYITLTNDGNLFNLLNVVIGLIIGTGAMFQALLGWWLVKRYIRVNNSLHLPKEILYFALLTGPVSCVVASTIGNVGLCLLNILSFNDFPLSWVTWWIGDSIGVLIITPVFLILFAKPRKLWRARILPILLPLCLTFIIVIIAHTFYSHSELKRVQTKFAELTQYKLNLLASELKFMNENANTLSLFLSTTPFINKEIFQHQANLLLQKNPMIQSIHWVPKITNPEDFKEKYKLKIWVANWADSKSKSVYYPILYTVSKHQNIFPSGYDLLSNPNFAESIKNQNVDLNPLKIKNDLNSILITSPVNRLSQFAGFVVMQINFRDLINQVFDNFLYYSNLSVKINSPGAKITPIFNLYNKQYPLSSTYLFDVSYPIHFKDSTWTFSAILSPYFINFEYSWQVWSALTATLFFCVLMNIILFILYGQRYLIQFLIEAKTVQLNTERAKNLLLLNAASEGIFWIDGQYKITFINPAAENLLGYSCDELKELSITKVLGETTSISHKATINKLPIHEAMREKTVIKIKEAVFIKKDQSYLWVEYTCIPILINRQVKGAAIIFSDISERIENEKKLIKLAHFDPLTQLPNRLSFFDYLEHSLARAHRNNTKLGVCFIDIDNFKTVNDQLGHVYGDKLLRLFPDIVIPHLREVDYLARIGGDEFGLVLEEINEPDVVKIFQRILASFHKKIKIDDQFIKTSISIGIAIYPDNGLDSQTLFNNADLAMYQGKSKGKSTFTFFENNGS
ncbi:MAG: diguanylate cyclase [Tatlockia sp.]|nr:diguanylate cyclase [Tatlockia sp.]